MEFSGILHQVDNIINKEGKDGRIYSSRTFVLRYVLENKDQFVKFHLDPPNLNIIESFEVGQHIKVKFNMVGWVAKALYNPQENVIIERKVVNSIKIDPKAIMQDDKKTRLIAFPTDGYAGPDLTKDFSNFPDHIAF